MSLKSMAKKAVKGTVRVARAAKKLTEGKPRGAAKAYLEISEKKKPLKKMMKKMLSSKMKRTKIGKAWSMAPKTAASSTSRRPRPGMADRRLRREQAKTEAGAGKRQRSKT